jgi:hypothetical protein
MGKNVTGKFAGFLVIAVCMATITNVSLATMSLGWWQEGAAGSTHEYWDFTPGYVTPSGDGYSAIPESIFSPNASSVVATITGGTWDGSSIISGISPIKVALQIANYDNPNLYKDIWVDIGNATAINISVSAHDGTSSTFDYLPLGGQGDAEFGIRIQPNPASEKIIFWITDTATPDPVLDYIHVDTICTPEPVTIGLLGLGSLGLIRRKK